MRNTKVWLILGALDGLGYAAAKYLLLKEQIVIAICDSRPDHKFETVGGNLIQLYIDPLSDWQIDKDIKDITMQYGSLDFIINNSNHQLFNKLANAPRTQIMTDLNRSIMETTDGDEFIVISTLESVTK